MRSGTERVKASPNQPCHPDKNSNQRKIRVAIGHLLRADLHQTDHRHKGAEIPRPTNKNERKATPRCHDKQADHGEQDDRQADRPDAEPFTGMGIIDRQLKRNDGVTQIRGIRRQRICATRRERNGIQRRDGMTAALGHSGNDGERHGEQKKWCLLRRQPYPTFGPPTERPEIKQQKDEGERDQCRLR